MDDGSKIRSWEGEAKPLFPESIDLKITDYCDAGCAYCHEKSTRRGLPADLNNILNIVGGLPHGVELAIGGGNPLSHPELLWMLALLKEKGLVVNLTVNSVHLRQYVEAIEFLRKGKLIYGLGISYHPDYLSIINAMSDENTVIHVIAGIHNTQDIRKLINKPKRKLLVLGYKQFGFGLKFYKPEVEHCIREWKYWIGSFLRTPNTSISFDNLGLEQLEVKKLIPPEIWNERFMGNDGTFTMYIDAVRDEFARTSTGVRIAREGRTVQDIFAEIRSRL